MLKNPPSMVGFLVGKKVDKLMHPTHPLKVGDFLMVTWGVLHRGLNAHQVLFQQGSGDQVVEGLDDVELPGLP